MKEEIYIFDDKQALAKQLADDFKKAADNLQDGGKLTVALSGGSTPRSFFRFLVQEPYLNTIDWNRINFYWGDERCVPPDNVQSNFKMANDEFLSKININHENIHRVFGENPPPEEAKRYEREIIDNLETSDNGFPRFDWIMLGMGEDGHTASLFPGASTLDEKQRICVVATHPQSGQKRISLTLPVLDNAKRVSFLVAGESKIKVLTDIIGNRSSNLPFPSSMVHPVDGLLEWYLDKAAATNLLNNNFLKTGH